MYKLTCSSKKETLSKRGEVEWASKKHYQVVLRPTHTRTHPYLHKVTKRNECLNPYSNNLSGIVMYTLINNISPISRSYKNFFKKSVG